MKYRVIVDNISFYTNTRSIKNGVGDHTSVNFAVQTALTKLKHHRKSAKDLDDIVPTGIGMQTSGHNVQLDIHYT